MVFANRTSQRYYAMSSGIKVAIYGQHFYFMALL
jgi:hypothetical protein